MLKRRNKAVLKNERLRIFRAILMQTQTLYKIDSNKSIQQNNFSKNVPIMTKNYILNSLWLYNDARGIKLCGIFVLSFKEWSGKKKKQESAGKNPEAYGESKKVNEFEQKPVDIVEGFGEEVKQPV